MADQNSPTNDPNQLISRYNPSEVEPAIYQKWLDAGCFKASDLSRKPPYSIILPPPNVTGSLHLGHALDHTIQDVLIRWKRMQGFNAMWLPGTDHAGIATQMVVERELKKDKITRKQLGREAFVEKVWEWKAKSGSTIVEQMKRLGNSCDWERHRFTLDEGVSRAVRRVFVDLYKNKLIYQGTRLVNWDTQLETAVSDLEVEYKEEKGHLWHIRYPVVGGGLSMTVATTRPETLLGDTALCVNPNDERYSALVGKKVVLPLLNREIPIIADDYVDRGFGSGVVKITPAHDFNDYQVGQRHSLPSINILNLNGTLNEAAGPYAGLKVQEARVKVLEDLKEQGLLEKEEPHVHQVPVSDRTGQRIEPMLSPQWFVSIKDLAEPAKRVVESGTIQFVPSSWTKTYLHWMNNIQDWCISRQLWWGHRIPAWTCEDCKHVTVSEKDATECEKCHSKKIAQDPDVLDTWFSSALWPFSTMGWPEETEAQKTFFPTTILVTGHDIIFFWVARMIMMGLHFKRDVPFRTIFIHGLVRDSQGRKMSKSVGNTLDPLEMIDKHGADSLRFAIMAQIATGRDLKFSEQRLEGYRNFMNKIWNAARFSLSVLADFQAPAEGVKAVPVKGDLSLADQWILHRLQKVVVDSNEALESYRFSDAANAIYGFVWYDLCDWYLEFIKPTMYGTDGATKSEKSCTQLVLAQVFNRIIRLLHPFAPFISEEIYGKLPIRTELCATASYPNVDEDKALFELGSEVAARDMELVKETITVIRNIRGENRISPSTEIDAKIDPIEEIAQKILGQNRGLIMKFGRLKSCEIAPVTSMSKCAVSGVNLDELSVKVVIPLEGLVNFDEEIKRLEKAIEKAQKDIGILSGRLENADFVKNAPEDVIVRDKESLAQMRSQLQIWQESMARLRV